MNYLANKNPIIGNFHTAFHQKQSYDDKKRVLNNVCLTKETNTYLNVAFYIRSHNFEVFVWMRAIIKVPYCRKIDISTTK